MLQVEPVIINLQSEESDQDSIKGVSPIKAVSRPLPLSDNPLDYFLNAKPWVDPNATRENILRSESPSPPRRRRSSLSPERRSKSPDGRTSPDLRVRRRSVSVDRQVRRRSLSADRSRSPEWRDRRRFDRRSRTPEYKHPRSPVRGRGRGPGDLRSKLRPVASAPSLPEVKVTGSKIISIKKDKPEEEAEIKEEKPSKEPSKENFEKEPVKSLEEIYRERALLSLMEAKRKKIMENKRKKFETLKQPETRTSESERSDKSEKSSDERKVEGAEEEEDDTSSDSEVADIDLAADVDIELCEGDLEPQTLDDDEENSKDGSSSQSDSRRIRTKSVQSPSKGKLGIKSRLGLRAVQELALQAEKKGPPRSRPMSVKDRLGLKVSGAGDAADRQRPLGGVVRLSRHGDEGQITREVRGIIQSRRHKKPLVVPQITINNRVDVEERKSDIKQRLGLLDDDENSDGVRKRKKKETLDSELFRLLQEENVDIEESEMDLLTKKEKKKLLKKLLAQQGREHEYEALKKRKKKSSKKKKDRDGDKSTERYLKAGQEPVGSRSEVEEEEEEDLGSGDEIELGVDEVLEGAPHEFEESSNETKASTVANSEALVIEEDPPRAIVSKLSEESHMEKEARLREALEPKTLEDIRRERREKRAKGSGIYDARKIMESKGRIIVEREIEEPEKPGPQVRVTFEGLESYTKRKLPRLERPVEQNENKQPESRPLAPKIKRDRQIYVPPSFKRTEPPPDTANKVPGPPAGRQIINYGDVYVKKATPTPNVSSDRAAPGVGLSTISATEGRKPLKLQRGPPKVEVKDATVKTFAEIMAEKKRKRLQAQQASQEGKRRLPAGFTEAETETNSAESFSSLAASPSSSQDIPESPSVPSHTTPLQRPHPCNIDAPSSANLTSSSTTVTSKPLRWKRQKTSEAQPETISETKHTQKQSASMGTSTRLSVEKQTARMESDISDSDANSNLMAQDKASTNTSSADSGKEMPVVAKSQSASSVDLDDHFLDMSDDDDLDLDLAGAQDHDELMREIDELLA